MEKLKSIDTDRLLLVPVSIIHTEELFKVYNDQETTHYVPREQHKEAFETEALIKRYINLSNENKAYVYSIVLKNYQHVIGTAGLYTVNLEHERASVGAVLHSNFWGKGYATEALENLMTIGFTEIGFARIEGLCMHTNKASEKMLKKLGMKYEGTLRSDVKIKGNRYDSLVYSILRDEFQ